MRTYLALKERSAVVSWAVSVIDDRFGDHPVHAAIQSAQVAHSTALSRDDLDDEVVGFLSFAGHAISTLPRLLSSVDPELVPLNLLQEAETNCNDVAARLNQFAQGGDRNHVTGLPTPIDAINRVSAMLAGIATIGQSEEGLQEAVTSYRRSAGQHVANLASQVSNFTENVNSLETRVADQATTLADQQSRVDTVISDHQKQFSEAQQTRTQQWADELKDFTDTRSELIDSANESTKAAVDSASESTKAAVKTINDQGARAVASLETRAAAVMSELEERRTQARNLIEATAVDAVAANYKSAAASDTTAANQWRIAALVFMGLGITTLVLLAIVFAPSSGLDWISLLRAFLIGGAFAAPALYAQRESNKHRLAARRNQRFALELDALEPFLANFKDPGSEVEIKRSFADRVFGGMHDETRDEDPTGDLTYSGLIELANMLAKKL